MSLTHKQKIGIIGENIAVKHIVKHNFKILQRNYRKKWGEIDIIAKKDRILHFIEVKSILVSYETFKNIEKTNSFVPEENVHYWKKKRLIKAISSYLTEKKVSSETKLTVDVIAVFLNLQIKKAKLRIRENVL